MQKAYINSNLITEDDTDDEDKLTEEDTVVCICYFVEDYPDKMWSSKQEMEVCITAGCLVWTTPS